VLRGSVQRRFIVHGCAANDKTLFVRRSGHSHESSNLARLADTPLATSFVYQRDFISVQYYLLSHSGYIILPVLTSDCGASISHWQIETDI